MALSAWRSLKPRITRIDLDRIWQVSNNPRNPWLNPFGFSVCFHAWRPWRLGGKFSLSAFRFSGSSFFILPSAFPLVPSHVPINKFQNQRRKREKITAPPASVAGKCPENASRRIPHAFSLYLILSLLRLFAAKVSAFRFSLSALPQICSKKTEKNVDAGWRVCEIGVTHGNNNITTHYKMKSKTLLIAAAALAAGVMSSSAAVYSQNIVGYINASIPAGGYGLIQNPLDTGNNVLTNIIPAGNPSLPLNIKVYPFAGGTYPGYTLHASSWSSGASGLLLNPGTGFFLFNPASTNITITFVGNVLTGTNLVPFVTGYNIVGCPTPLSGAVQTSLGLPAVLNDKVYQFNPVTSGYPGYTRHASSWGGGEPQIGTNTLYGVAESFFYDATYTGTWTNVFNP